MPLPLAAGLGASALDAEILIGLAGPITGKMAWFGEQHQSAVEMAVSDINERGGLLGQTVEFVVADDYRDAGRVRMPLSGGRTPATCRWSKPRPSYSAGTWSRV